MMMKKEEEEEEEEKEERSAVNLTKYDNIWWLYMYD
jgi:hypothetical protein